MKKYLAYYETEWPANIAELTAIENKPFVGYLKGEGAAFTVIPKEIPSGYQMIDLGLSVKWADRNVGAKTPQDGGLYFSWGNIDGHAADENGNITDGYLFNDTAYATTLGGQYTGSTLDAEHDAATVNMGSDWRMPTSAETSELIENTDHYYIGEDGSIVAGPFNHTTNYSNKGLDGSNLRSICFVKKGESFDYNNRSNFIEFPFAGSCKNSLLYGVDQQNLLWTSSYFQNDAKSAHSLYFTSDGYLLIATMYRSRGYSVRGVHA